MNKNIITFGCRLNACESDLIQDFVGELNLSNFTIINTCSVTAEAERKLRQTIRKIQKDNPEAKIILTGCASEFNPDSYMKIKNVVGIIPNSLKLSKEQYLKYSSSNSDSDKSNKSENANQSPSKKIRGFLQIQNGCDQKCTYCIVRTTRGVNISLNENDIVEQAKNLLNKGVKEIVLTGVNISSYGKDMQGKRNLSYIIRYILKNVPNLKRLRLSSLDPADIDDELIKILANENRLLPHIHESIQSGDNIILKRMIRRHTRESVIEVNQKILQARPDIVFGADIIVGFPTETDEMFLNTKKLLNEASLSLSHIFPFSPRQGTPAALMPKLERKTILERARELRFTSKQILLNKLSEYVGKQVVALAENEKNARTDSFLYLKSNTKLIVGKEYLFHCKYVDGITLVGEPVNN